LKKIFEIGTFNRLCKQWLRQFLNSWNMFWRLSGINTAIIELRVYECKISAWMIIIGAMSEGYERTSVGYEPISVGYGWVSVEYEWVSVGFRASRSGKRVHLSLTRTHDLSGIPARDMSTSHMIGRLLVLSNSRRKIICVTKMQKRCLH